MRGTSSVQDSILSSDGYEDYRQECVKSGEPLITTMRLQHEDDELPQVSPYVWTLVGQPRMRTAFEVRPCLLLLVAGIDLSTVMAACQGKEGFTKVPLRLLADNGQTDWNRSTR